MAQKLSPALKREICREYYDYPVEYLVEKHDISSATVYNILKEFNMPYKQDLRREKKKRLLRTILSLFDSGSDIEDIAKEVNKSEKYILNILKKARLKELSNYIQEKKLAKSLPKDYENKLKSVRSQKGKYDLTGPISPDQAGKTSVERAIEQHIKEVISVGPKNLLHSKIMGAYGNGMSFKEIKKKFQINQKEFYEIFGTFEAPKRYEPTTE